MINILLPMSESAISRFLFFIKEKKKNEPQVGFPQIIGSHPTTCNLPLLKERKLI